MLGCRIARLCTFCTLCHRSGATSVVQVFSDQSSVPRCAMRTLRDVEISNHRIALLQHDYPIGSKCVNQSVAQTSSTPRLAHLCKCNVRTQFSPVSFLFLAHSFALRCLPGRTERAILSALLASKLKSQLSKIRSMSIELSV